LPPLWPGSTATVFPANGGAAASASATSAWTAICTQGRYPQGIRRLFLVPLVTLLSAGCGGETKVVTTTAAPVRTASAADAADCLNSDQFLVEVSGADITGNAPDGVAFVIRFYHSRTEASAAAARLNPKYARAMGAAVIDYHGNPPARPGGPPMVLIRDDFKTLQHCLLLR